MRLTITGQVPPKKNAKQLVYANGKPRLIPSKRHAEWEKDALWQLKGSKASNGKVAIFYSFYVKDNRSRDLDNMIASVNDVLVKAGLLGDDNWQHLRIGHADAKIDKETPRVELVIEKT